MEVKIVSTRKKKQQNMRLFSRPLSQRDTDFFMIAQNNPDEQTESRDNMICRGTSSGKVSDPTQVIHSRVNVQTLEENVVSKRHSEVDDVLTSVETGVQD